MAKGKYQKWLEPEGLALLRLVPGAGVNQINQKYREQSMDYLGTDLVEVSAHIGARNTGDGPANHESWQGKVYRWKEKQWTTAEEIFEQRKLIQGIDARTGIQRSAPQKSDIENVTTEYLRLATLGIGEISYDAWYVVSRHSEEIK